MSNFFGSLFGGQNDTLNTDMGQFGTEANFGNQQGQKNVTAASDFYDGILSGDATQEAQALAPEIGAAKGAAQQKKNGAAQFGSRSGGTAANIAATDDKVMGDVTGLLGGLKGTAASGAASLGTAEQGIGMQAQEQRDKLSQQQLQNWKDSIFGSAISGGVGALQTFGEGKLASVFKPSSASPHVASPASAPASTSADYGDYQPYDGYGFDF